MVKPTSDRPPGKNSSSTNMPRPLASRAYLGAKYSKPTMYMAPARAPPTDVSPPMTAQRPGTRHRQHEHGDAHVVVGQVALHVDATPQDRSFDVLGSVGHEPSEVAPLQEEVLRVDREGQRGHGEEQTGQPYRRYADRHRQGGAHESRYGEGGDEVDAVVGDETPGDGRADAGEGELAEAD